MSHLIAMQPRGFGAHVCWDLMGLRWCSTYGHDATICNHGLEVFKPMRDQALRELKCGRPLLANQLVCINNWHSNYFHFLLETLPALARGLEAIERDRLSFDGVLIDHCAGYVRYCLDKFAYNGPVKEAVGAAVPLQAPIVAQPVDLQAVSPSQRRLLMIDVVLYLRSFFLNELLEASGRVDAPKRVFVERGLGCRDSSNFGFRRRLEPQKRFHRDLLRNSFHIVYLEQMTLAEQIILFAAADEVVAVHGAALTNIVFCRPDCRISEIVIDRYAEGTLFQDLAAAAGLSRFRTLLAASALDEGEELEYWKSLGPGGVKPDPLRLPLRYDEHIRESLSLL